jgi:hypothetical protein
LEDLLALSEKVTERVIMAPKKLKH